jgi:predicted ABC-type ATPase
MPHCTQREGSGTTCPEASTVRRVESLLKRFKNDMMIPLISRQNPKKVTAHKTRKLLRWIYCTTIRHDRKPYCMEK